MAATASARSATAWRTAGLDLVLLGETRDELDGSAWAGLHGHLGGQPPVVDLAAEKALASFFVDAVRRGVLASSHDLSDGGLAVALAESVLTGGTGASVDLSPVLDRDGIDAFTALYSESTARALVTVRSESDLATVVGIAEAHGVPVARLGATDADRLKVTGPTSLAGESIKVFRVNAQGKRLLVTTNTLNSTGDRPTIVVADSNGGAKTTYVVRLLASQRVQATDSNTKALR